MYNAPFDRDYFIESKFKNAPRTIEKRAIVLAIEDGIEAPRVKYLEWSNSPHVG